MKTTRRDFIAWSTAAIAAVGLERMSEPPLGYRDLLSRLMLLYEENTREGRVFSRSFDSSLRRVALTADLARGFDEAMAEMKATAPAVILGLVRPGSSSRILQLAAARRLSLKIAGYHEPDILVGARHTFMAQGSEIAMGSRARFEDGAMWPLDLARLYAEEIGAGESILRQAAHAPGISGFPQAAGHLHSWILTG